MSRRLLISIVIAALLVVSFSAITACIKVEADARVEELESRVAQLEGMMYGMVIILSNQEVLPDDFLETYEEIVGARE